MSRTETGEQAHERRCALSALSIPRDNSQQGAGHRTAGEGGSGGGGGERGGDGREATRKNATNTANRREAASNGPPERSARRRHMDSLKQRAGEGIQAALELKFEGLQPQMWHLLQTALRTAQDYLQESEEERQAVENDRRGLQAKLENQGARTTNSWAQVAGGPTPHPNQARKAVYLDSSPPPTMADNAKAKQMTVRFDDEEIRKAFAGSTSTQLVHTFRNDACPAAASIVAARRTTRGDIILNTTTVEARQELEEATEWAKSVNPSARILRQTCLIGVHGMRKDAVDDSNQASAIEILKRDNAGLHPGLKLVSVRWPRFASEPDQYGREKRYSLLVIEVAGPDTANRLIAEGLLESSQIHHCETWIRSADPKQCYNCQQYGHMCAACTNETKCGSCAGSHQTREHSAHHQKEAKCAVCGGKHISRSKECSIRQKEIHRMQQKIQGKPKWYAVPPRSPIQPIAAGSQKGRVDAEGFQVVGPTRGVLKRKALGERTRGTSSTKEGRETEEDQYR